MVLDIAAVQSVYGADPTTRAGDTVDMFGQHEAVILPLYDGGGNDTIDPGSFTRSNTVDLRPEPIRALAGTAGGADRGLGAAVPAVCEPDVGDSLAHWSQKAA